MVNSSGRNRRKVKHSGERFPSSDGNSSTDITDVRIPSNVIDSEITIRVSSNVKSFLQPCKLARANGLKDASSIYEHLENRKVPSAEQIAKDVHRFMNFPIDFLEKCMICGQHGSLSCSKCKSAIYCSKACQMVNWNEHKLFCKRLEEKYNDIIQFSRSSCLRNIEFKCLSDILRDVLMYLLFDWVHHEAGVHIKLSEIITKMYSAIDKLKLNIEKGEMLVINKNIMDAMDRMQSMDLREILQSEAFIVTLSYCRCMFLMKCLATPAKDDILKFLEILHGMENFLRLMAEHRATLINMRLQKNRELSHVKTNKYEVQNDATLPEYRSEIEILIQDSIMKNLGSQLTSINELKDFIQRAKELLFINKFLDARKYFRRAIELKNINADTIDWLLLFEAMCFLKTNNVTEIIKGLDLLAETDITEWKNRPSICFYYLSLAMQYYALKDYSYALNNAELGLHYLTPTMIEKMGWGDDILSLIKELYSTNDVQYLLTRMKYDSKFRPKPNGTCRYEDCYSCNVQEYVNAERAIYTNEDVDFKGFVTVICQDRCRVDYHTVCWKELKRKMMQIERKFLQQNCRTPNCISFVVKIEITKQSGEIKILE